MSQPLLLIRLVYLITVASTLVIAAAYQQQHAPDAWSPETQITDSPGDSRLVDLCTDASNHAVYLTWENNGEGTQEVYFMRSLDDGVNWGPELKISNLTYETTEPQPRIVANGPQILVFFLNRTETGEHVFYSTSNDSGTYFSIPLQLTNDSGDQFDIAAASVGSTVHLVWQRGSHIFYDRSTNFGRSWEREVELTNVAGTQDQYPAIAAVDNEVFVTWSRARDGYEAIYVVTSLDSGETWQSEVQVSEDVGTVFPEFPAIASNVTHVQLVWGNYSGVQYSRSSDQGRTWSDPIPLTNPDRQYVAPRITVTGSQIQVVTAGIINVTSDVFYLSSSDGGETWNTPLRLTSHTLTAQSLAPVITNEREGTFVVWEDNRNGHFAIFLLSKPDFLRLSESESRLRVAEAGVLAGTTIVYLGIELREWKHGAHRRRRGRRNISYRKVKTNRRNTTRE